MDVAYTVLKETGNSLATFQYYKVWLTILGFSRDLLPLQDVTPEGHRCFILRFADTDPDSFHFVDVLKTFFMVGDLQIRKDLDLSAGLVTIFDMTGWSFKHVPRLNLSALGKCIQYAQVRMFMLILGCFLHLCEVS